MHNTQSPALRTAPGLRLLPALSAWLNSPSRSLTLITGLRLSRREGGGMALCGALMAVALLLCSAAAGGEYGWAALCLYVAAQCALPGLRRMAQGEADETTKTNV